MANDRTIPLPTLPRAFLLGAGSAILAAMITVGVVVWNKPAPQPETEIPRVSLTVRFIEQPDGALSVVDQTTGREMDRIGEGQNGFLTTMLRVIRRDIERTPEVISMPFRIEAWQDNRITLTDSATERKIDLLAFGPTNAEIFVRWLSGRNGVQ